MGGAPGATAPGTPVVLNRNGRPFETPSGQRFSLEAGERVTLVPGVYHAFHGDGVDCVVGEVSTANDDANDNFFIDPDMGRFPEIEEDEAPLVRLISE